MQKTNNKSRFTVRSRIKINEKENVRKEKDRKNYLALSMISREDDNSYDILLDFIVNKGNIQSHAKKHDTIPNLPEGWKAGKRNISFWKFPYIVENLVTKAYLMYIDELLKFVQDETAEVLEMKVYVDETTGYLCRKGESEFYPVNWFCAIIQKTKDGLITKTCYPCEDPYKKK